MAIDRRSTAADAVGMNTGLCVCQRRGLAVEPAK